MSNPKPPPPKQPTTVALHQVPEWAIELTRSVKDGFARQNSQLLAFGERLVTLEEQQLESERRQHEFEGRLMRSSSRVKQVSESDLSQEALIAQNAVRLAEEQAAREALATQVAELATSQAKQTEMITDVRNAVVGTLNHPKVKFVGKLIFTAAMGYAVAKGIG